MMKKKKIIIKFSIRRRFECWNTHWYSMHQIRGCVAQSRCILYRFLKLFAWWYSLSATATFYTCVCAWEMARMLIENGFYSTINRIIVVLSVHFVSYNWRIYKVKEKKNGNEENHDSIFITIRMDVMCVQLYHENMEKKKRELHWKLNNLLEKLIRWMSHKYTLYKYTRIHRIFPPCVSKCVLSWINTK